MRGATLKVLPITESTRGREVQRDRDKWLCGRRMEAGAMVWYAPWGGTPFTKGADGCGTAKSKEDEVVDIEAMDEAHKRGEYPRVPTSCRLSRKQCTA